MPLQFWHGEYRASSDQPRQGAGYLPRDHRTTEDILVLMDEPAHGGSLVKVRVIGAIEADQIEEGSKHSPQKADDPSGARIARARGMQAVMTKAGPGDEIEACGIAGCPESVAYHLVKIRDDQSEEETFFCATHGEEYARRGHLTISEAA